ncbi:unnamed protein product [Anisakis simplex]|uniref:Uncharacterized transporter (inferred by orthology to a C. elegans protein) n=1 Tax=Anisakis simplex TaxID=6269 RepID=A0A0M3KGQ0_ANISI|nr:unnamed protein product [Anisakis simplex]
MLVSDFGVATIFLRIALNLAISLNIHPLYLGLPTAICPSLSSMFPMASPSNAIVYDAGVISIPEMALAGIILNVLVYVITIANMNTLAYWVFDFGTIPSDLRHLSLNTTCAY